MFNVGFAELLAILGLALVILGPAKLPDAVRTAGRVMGELRRISGDFQRELRDALEDGQVDEGSEQLPDTPPAALHPPPADGAASSDQAAEAAEPARTPRPTTSRTATNRPHPTGPASG
jgi:sec-independent protein translocase protein TatB